MNKIDAASRKWAIETKKQKFAMKYALTSILDVFKAKMKSIKIKQNYEIHSTHAAYWSLISTKNTLCHQVKNFYGENNYTSLGIQVLLLLPRMPVTYDYKKLDNQTFS